MCTHQTDNGVLESGSSVMEADMFLPKPRKDKQQNTKQKKNNNKTNTLKKDFMHFLFIILWYKKNILTNKIKNEKNKFMLKLQMFKDGRVMI